MFLYNELWSFIFKMGFKNCVLKILDIYVNPKDLSNKKIKDFKKFWGILVVYDFSKKFILVKIRKKTTGVTKIDKY